MYKFLKKPICLTSYEIYDSWNEIFLKMGIQMCFQNFDLTSGSALCCKCTKTNSLQDYVNALRC